ncbi:MAG: hypothetical protein CVU39_18890 [Chloroflexi bacterium HGW-Chloroflexi-10]|nr:MAG: hypothetical protein CVU39_18890 [Chloroflexi bacterium HGW-Chloroflexi-10]
MFQKVYDRAVDFIWRNARLLERRRFATHFLNEPKAAVITALRAYQNPDGGFGNALEPDKRYPGSNPGDVITAFYILDEIDAMNDPMAALACDYLLTITTAQGGVPFTLPQVKQYPHAPWWGTDDPNPLASINPTGDIAGVLLKNQVQHPWLEKAVPFCWHQQDPARSGYHDIMPAVEFLANVPDRVRAEGLLKEIKATIQREQLVSYDRNTSGYVKFPLDWAPAPTHALRDIFSEEQIEADLLALAAGQQEDGGWPISWEPVSAGVELEWRGIRTLEALLVLKAYGKLK